MGAGPSSSSDLPFLVWVLFSPPARSALTSESWPSAFVPFPNQSALACPAAPLPPLCLHVPQTPGHSSAPAAQSQPVPEAQGKVTSCVAAGSVQELSWGVSWSLSPLSPSCLTSTCTCRTGPPSPCHPLQGPHPARALPASLLCPELTWLVLSAAVPRPGLPGDPG